ncbi:MAG: phosphoribosylamine--glycine ligase [Kiloniellales bacterium]|nr:phosphoribosylamine--glycine ligase [Kiloniellales bacterium]
MKILVVGSGGREHALCWSIAASPLCDRLYCAPGNAGISEDATCLAIAAEDTEGLVAFAKEESIDLVVVGPEGPLVNGLVDRLEHEGIKAFGPRAAAAKLEGSKGFMKDICAKYGIPTAAYRKFNEPEEAKSYVRKKGAPIVVKTDGLAAGKGVTVASTLEEALDAIDQNMIEARFGEAGQEIVIEDFLEGEEASYFCLVDGKNFLPLASSQDHKRAFDNDEGPNTGGMGAYSPAPVMTPGIEAKVEERVITPLIEGLAWEGRPYKGLLYAGLMISEEGEPSVVEFNVRFGDPECQVVLMRLMSDLLPALVASVDGQLDHLALRWHDEAAVTVVMAAKGYPGPYKKGSEIGGLEQFEDDEDVVKVFHAGTRFGENGEILANGGRVLNVTATGHSIEQARREAYAAIDAIDWPEGFFRHDIAAKAIGRS